MTHGDASRYSACLFEPDSVWNLKVTAPSHPHSEHSASDEKQKSSYFFHSELQRILVNTCRFRSQRDTGLRSDTDTAGHILHQNCLSHTLTGETQEVSGLEKVISLKKIFKCVRECCTAQLNENDGKYIQKRPLSVECTTWAQWRFGRGRWPLDGVIHP